MSVHYPGNGRKNRSQDRDHLIGAASRHITENLSDADPWHGAEQMLIARHRCDDSKAKQIALEAVLDLEWDDSVTVTPEGLRPCRPGDPEQSELRVVADAIMALGWSADGPARKIRECHTQLWPRHRHCDVYWAMHEVLKGRQLRCHRAYWKALDGVDVLADPTLTAEQREEIIRELEAELRDDYADWLGHDVKIEWAVGSRRADLFDPSRELIVEAKIETDDVVVLGAVMQAALYRTMANQARHQVGPIAILLPDAPSDLVRTTLRQNDIDVGFIWRNGNAFVEDLG